MVHGAECVANLGHEDGSTNLAHFLLGAVLPVVNDLLGGKTVIGFTVGCIRTATHVVEHLLGGLAVWQSALLKRKKEMKLIILLLNF